MKKYVLITLTLVLVLLLAACSSESEVIVPKAENITCTAAYRAGVSQPIEREESFALADSDAEQSIAFTDMVFQAAYSAGESDNERGLRLWVTDVEETVVFQTQLYQFELNSGPQNQFLGGHGFTGLNYSYHPDTAAEMQFWCEVN